mgnify:CR=1 FL=1
MNRLTRAAAIAAAALLCTCTLTREKPNPVEIRVQNFSPYDLYLRDLPDGSRDPLLLLQSVDSLESSVKTFRYQPTSTDDRLTFYPYFLLPVASLFHPTLDSMIVYYEEFFVTDIYLTVRLSEQKKEYTANVNQWPRSVSYQKAYVEVENAGGAACEVLRGGTTLCSKSDFFVRGIGSINEETVADRETAVFAFDSGWRGNLTFRFLSGSAGDRVVSVPVLERGQIVRIRLLPAGEVEISEVEAVAERQ